MFPTLSSFFFFYVTSHFRDVGDHGSSQLHIICCFHFWLSTSFLCPCSAIHSHKLSTLFTVTLASFVSTVSFIFARPTFLNETQKFKMIFLTSALMNPVLCSIIRFIEMFRHWHVTMTNRKSRGWVNIWAKKSRKRFTFQFFI